MARPQRETSEEFFRHADVVREYASFDFLLAPERVIFDELEPRLSEARVLDLGVGGGRTTFHFLDRARTYVGVDYSPAMIDACRRRFDERARPEVSFVVADARDLSQFDRESFDFVLFAFQGLDSLVDHDDRLRALREIRRLLVPGGSFAFSSDNLDYARNTLSIRRAVQDLLRAERRQWLTLARRPRLIARALARPLRLRRVNEPRRTLRGYGRYVYLRPRHELTRVGHSRPNELIEIDGYTITPSVQVGQLAREGFVDVRIFSPLGTEVSSQDDAALEVFPWLYYLCTKPVTVIDPAR